MKTNDLLAKIAYVKWQDAGCPVSDGKEFWYQAEKEFFERVNSNHFRDLMDFINPSEDLEELVGFCNRWGLADRFINWMEIWIKI